MERRHFVKKEGAMSIVVLLLAISIMPFSMGTGVKPNMVPELGYPRASVEAAVFTSNMGQFPKGVLFATSVNGATIYLYKHQVVTVFCQSGSETSFRSILPRDFAQSSQSDVHSVVLDFLNSSEAVSVSGVQQAGHYNNYFLGNDPGGWIVDVPNFGEIFYKGLYPGIDLRYYLNTNQLEYDFIVNPGADPSLIQMRYQGIESLQLLPSGALELTTRLGVINEQVPRCYQKMTHFRREVQGCFTLSSDRTIGFDVEGVYDARFPLIIDPVLTFSTYFGGAGSDQAWGVAVDPAGNSYVTGLTDSTDFPLEHPYDGTVNGDDDIFICKFSPDNRLLYSTYLGGGFRDGGFGIAVDDSGNAYISGATYSLNFPVVNAFDPSFNGDSDAILAELSPTGDTLLYSTYLGGSLTDVAIKIAVNFDAVVLTGYTQSLDFPVMNPYDGSLNGGFDIFISKFSTESKALIFSTFIGGTQDDWSWGIAIDSSCIVMSGYTQSIDFPTLNAYDPTFNGVMDAVVVKFDVNNTLVFSTYLGGSDEDGACGIALDKDSNVYVTGNTFSSDFPLANPCDPIYHGYFDVFVSKLSSLGDSLVFSTFLGGYGYENGWSIAVGEDGTCYVTGYTASPDFPTKNPVQNYLGAYGYTDGFLTRYSPSGDALLFSTFLGGTDEDEVYDVAVDSRGSVHVCGVTSSTDLLLIDPLSSTLSGSCDAYIITLSNHFEPPLMLTITGGRGIQAEILNPGNYSRTVDWRIHVQGGILGRLNLTVNGTEEIAPTESTTVSTGTLLGFGKITVIAEANDKNATASGTQILLWSILKKENN